MEDAAEKTLVDEQAKYSLIGAVVGAVAGHNMQYQNAGLAITVALGSYIGTVISKLIHEK
jgi:uncharacterized membrane protein YeaQ/YmgE (transglycosylase-associated protein family)